MREYKFQFTVTCVGDGTADEQQVELMIDLAMQDLVYDDEFISALDEKEAVSIQVSRIG
jgi:Holliday junction resolvasome RuvABC endonuclease subunit